MTTTAHTTETITLPHVGQLPDGTWVVTVWDKRGTWLFPCADLGGRFAHEAEARTYAASTARPTAYQRCPMCGNHAEIVPGVGVCRTCDGY